MVCSASKDNETGIVLHPRMPETMNDGSRIGRQRRSIKGVLIILLLCLCLVPIFPVFAADTLSSVESSLSASAREQSTTHARDHIVLVWPKEMKVNWYPESKVDGPDQLADWLEKCYGLCIGWLGINPNAELNAGKTSSQRARLIFVHNGMRDYNLGGNLPRPVIGLRDFSGVGSEDWFGWLTHELSHEFLLRFREVKGTPEDNAWHEALCDYMRYWLLKESGMPRAAKNWRTKLRNASPMEPYQGGANIIMEYHDRNEFKSPFDLWKKIKGKGLARVFGEAPWLTTGQEDNDSVVTLTADQTLVAFEAEIDGAGSFTFRDDKVFYEHFTWQYPTRVKINGKTWDDLDRPFELDCVPEFASAKVIDQRGRNTMAIIPHEDRLVIFIDDAEDSSAPYRIIIVMDKRKQPATVPAE